MNTIQFDDLEAINGGGLLAAVPGVILGGAWSMTAGAIGAVATGNDITGELLWKSYVTGAALGGSVGAVLPTP